MLQSSTARWLVSFKVSRAVCGLLCQFCNSSRTLSHLDTNRDDLCWWAAVIVLVIAAVIGVVVVCMQGGMNDRVRVQVLNPLTLVPVVWGETRWSLGCC